MSVEEKKPRKRAVKNEVKLIPAPAEKTAKANFFAADKKSVVQK